MQLLDVGITEIGTMAETYVPLISSGTAGPLGVLHLPRLWQKVSLEEAGKLASGYPGIGHGFDAMTLAALGLEEQAVRDYIRQSKPTYPQFEACSFSPGGRRRSTTTPIVSGGRCGECGTWAGMKNVSPSRTM